MFKLVVLCAFFAAAAAKPGALIAAPIPITQYATYLTPGATTITTQDQGVIHPSPLFYQAPLAYTHFIKKRSAQFPLTYAAPATYYPNYYATTTYNAPLIHTAPILPAPIASIPAVHLIKKRSVVQPAPAPAQTPVTDVIAPLANAVNAAATPLLNALNAATAPILSQPLIEKRSAGLFNAYIAPTSYSHQSRFDLQGTQFPYTSISYAAPALAYSSPLAYSNPIAYTSPLAVSHVY